MNVKYVGAFGDYSGYGEANRNAIRALVADGVNVTTERVTHVSERANFGRSFKEAAKVEGKDLDYKIKVIHITPDGYIKHLEPMKYHIGHLFWETSKLPPSWVWNCNLLDEIWTGDWTQASIFEKSGVTVPVTVLPQAIETDLPDYKPFLLKKRPEFLFYSIFQWIERKNPRALLQAYWQEFATEDVGLMIKTYGLDFTKKEKNKIYIDIAKWKKELHLEKYPKVYIYDELMDRDDVFRFHATGDCFVLPHRGEGWGVTQVEATLMGKPVISTNAGGVHEWINSFIPVNSTKIPLFNMDYIPWYTNDQEWADPSVSNLRKQMRWVYENRKGAAAKAAKTKKTVTKLFNFRTVGGAMRARLEVIEKNIIY